ncbi:alpha beta hydrolase fold protein, partial [Nannochloropsis gaditana CCMP526]|uniref:alpha beta hydrolase fold protein n=1 Tax=Nannochloropsis gaditana (strain CCMP526) TaxID=1093141 RepID=UPI00029F7CE2
MDMERSPNKLPSGGRCGGFGASVGHFRNQFRDLPPLGYRVFAVDLLGFGGSDKVKAGVDYELELWRDLLVDFMQEMEARGTASTTHGWTVGGNSIGGLLTLMVAVARGAETVKGWGLTSFREEELPWILRPLWIFVRVVLFGDIFGPGLFQRFRTEENVRSVLAQVYGNETAVDDELVDVLLTPGLDDGAEEVFLKVLRAPAGPSPEELLPQIQVPVIGIWGVSKCST